jgi:DNA polymerase III delta prime subunit
MDGKYTVKLPEDNIIKNSEYLTTAIKEGQSIKEETLIILCGSSEKMKRNIAAAVVFGNKNPEYRAGDVGKKEDAPKCEDDEIQQYMEQHMFKWGQNYKFSGIKEEAGQDEAKREFRFVLDQYEVVSNIREETERLDGHRNIMSAILSQEVCDGYFVGGSIGRKWDDEFFENVQEIMEHKTKNRILFIAIESLSENMIKRFEFEMDAKVIQVREPDMKFYQDMFLYELKQRSCKLAEGTSVSDVVCMVRNYRGEDFSAADFGKAIKKAACKAAQYQRACLELHDFNLFGEGYLEPEQELERMIGLEKVKKKIARMVALRDFDVKRCGPNYRHGSYHLGFAGDPGTGKSKVAGIYAKILAKCGITNGKFVCAAKSDYIGTYVGVTAKRMRDLFETTRGGIIFFDEAATFLTEDIFAQEALTELVRFMEMYPDVICIFASYEENINAFLEKDAGLRSRISEILVFDNYSNEELYEILEEFCQAENFLLQDARDIFYDFVDAKRSATPKSFGNARLSRNVYEKAKEVTAMETMKKGIDPAKVNTISRECIAEAIQELNENSTGKKKIQRVGFTV